MSDCTQTLSVELKRVHVEKLARNEASVILMHDLSEAARTVLSQPEHQGDELDTMAEREKLLEAEFDSVSRDRDEWQENTDRAEAHCAAAERERDDAETVLEELVEEFERRAEDGGRMGREDITGGDAFEEAASLAREKAAGLKEERCERCWGRKTVWEQTPGGLNEGEWIDCPDCNPAPTQQDELTGVRCEGCDKEQRVGDEGWKSRDALDWCPDCFTEDRPAPTQVESETIAQRIYETWSRVARIKGYEVETPRWDDLPSMYQSLCVAVTKVLRTEGIVNGQD